MTRFSPNLRACSAKEAWTHHRLDVTGCPDRRIGVTSHPRRADRAQAPAALAGARPERGPPQNTLRHYWRDFEGARREPTRPGCVFFTAMAPKAVRDGGGLSGALRGGWAEREGASAGQGRWQLLSANTRAPQGWKPVWVPGRSSMHEPGRWRRPGFLGDTWPHGWVASDQDPLGARLVCVWSARGDRSLGAWRAGVPDGALDGGPGLAIQNLGTPLRPLSWDAAAPAPGGPAIELRVKGAGMTQGGPTWAAITLRRASRVPMQARAVTGGGGVAPSTAAQCDDGDASSQ